MLAGAAFRYKDGQVTLAKCSEPLAIRWSRQIPADCSPSTITVKLDARGRWFVSLLVDEHTLKPLPKTDKSIGLDVGVSSLIATSNRDKIANPKHFKRLDKNLRRLQKAYARKQKRSNNRQKARLKVARIHGQITDARSDFLHQLTTQLLRENQTIVVEDLAIKNQVKNHKLAQSISDASWGASFVGEASPTNVACELVRQLAYKCEWYGRELIKIDRWFPSSKRCGNCGHIALELVKIDRRFPSRKRCGSCGHVVDTLPLNLRQWECPQCTLTHDRDINAAHNILAAGLAVIVCGANIRPDSHEVKGQLRKTRKANKQKPK